MANPQYLLLDKSVFAHGGGDPSDEADRVSTTTLRKFTAEGACAEITASG